MVNVLAGIFLILHGLVHMLYFGHSLRFFAMQERMNWPDGAWFFSRVFGDTRTMKIVAGGCVIATALFVTGAIALFSSQAWWYGIILTAAGFSTGLYLLCFDGRLKSLPNKGLFGILINIAIIVLVTVFDFPGVA